LTRQVPPFEPFRAVRFAESLAPEDVTAPPYDVIDADDRAALVARSPENAVVIDLPVEADGPGRYEQAAVTMARWQADGVLVTDPAPTFTVHRMAYVDDGGRPAQTLGVLGALGLEPPGQGILPHEHTTPKAKSDRLDLMRATQAQLSAVWVLSLAGGLSDLLGDLGEPRSRWTDPDGVEHTVWTVTDAARLEAIGSSVASAPVVVADGHHRYETALTYRDEVGGTGGTGAMLAYAVELVEDQLTVRPIHRLLTGLPEGFDLPGALGDRFDVEPERDASLDDLRALATEGLVLVRPGGRAVLLRPRPGAFDGVPDLDSARLSAALEGLPVEVTYQHGVDRVVKAVDGGEAQAGVLVRPATVAQIRANAASGERMPPKTTFFHPKPPTGIVFRDLR
jgi:uncharacterized protein (DUF1015 family)